MTTLADRLKLALARLDPPRTQADLARATKRSGPSVSNWFTGESKSMNAQSAVLAAAFLKVRLEWLVYGAGPMREGDPPPVVAASVPPLAESLDRVLFALAELEDAARLALDRVWAQLLAAPTSATLRGQLLEQISKAGGSGNRTRRRA